MVRRTFCFSSSSSVPHSKIHNPLSLHSVLFLLPGSPPVAHPGGLLFLNSRQATTSSHCLRDNSTPFSSSGDISIDPALSETPIDLTPLAEEGMSRRTEVRFFLFDWDRRSVGEDIPR